MTLDSARAADPRLVGYYARRAREYERVYEKPERQADLALLRAVVVEELAGHDVLALAAFWWSHVPRRGLPAFLSTLHARLGAGARVVFLDNRCVAGSSTPIAFRDEAGDTWQERRLESGETHLVLKNFPDAAELTAATAGGRDVRIELLRHYWLLSYTVAGA